MAARFDDLVDSRKRWIAEVLQPWCRAAALKELRMAEQEWQDIAGRVAPERSLWFWAWSRFPDLVEEGLSDINETYPVTVRLNSGETLTGIPDARRSLRGVLYLVSDAGDVGPLSLDDIEAVERQ